MALIPECLTIKTLRSAIISEGTRVTLSPYTLTAELMYSELWPDFHSLLRACGPIIECVWRCYVRVRVATTLKVWPQFLSVCGHNSQCVAPISECVWWCYVPMRVAITLKVWPHFFVCVMTWPQPWNKHVDPTFRCL